jgi:hypothetical protein
VTIGQHGGEGGGDRGRHEADESDEPHGRRPPCVPGKDRERDHVGPVARDRACPRELDAPELWIPEDAANRAQGFSEPFLDYALHRLRITGFALRGKRGKIRGSSDVV